MELLTSPEAWAALLTLTALEIVLGIDNVIFISVIVSRIPEQQAKRARQIGLALALVFRIMLLSVLVWLIGLTAARDHGEGPRIFVARHHPDRRRPVPDREGDPRNSCRGRSARGGARRAAEGQRLLLGDHADHRRRLVFSLDSIITAIGMAQDIEIMVAAVVIACIVMYVSSGPVSRFVAEHPTTKMLALAFLVLIGVALVADGFQFHIPRGYIYFAIVVRGGGRTVQRARQAQPPEGRQVAGFEPGELTMRRRWPSFARVLQQIPREKRS